MAYSQLGDWLRWAICWVRSGIPPETKSRLKHVGKVYAVGWTCFGAVIASGILVFGLGTSQSVSSWFVRLGVRLFGVVILTSVIGLLWLAYHDTDDRKSESAIRTKIEEMRDLQGDITDPHTNLRLAESIGTLEWVLDEYDDDHYRESVSPDDDTTNDTEPQD